MATSRNIVAVFVLQIVLFCIQITAKFPNLDPVRTKALNLGTELDIVMTDASGIGTLKTAYDDSQATGEVNYKDVNGGQLVRTLAKELQKILEKKMKALKKSVEKAEEIAAAYTWNGDLTKETVVYVAAKEVNDSEYGYSDQFKQKVNFDNSSVHIPVEIYDGDVGILNGLEWSSALDEVWKENRDEDNGLLWQYFGSQLGIMRNYPASKWRDSGVDLYDVRRRPWYTQGASSPKNMLIMMDISGSTHGQALALMKQSVKSLLETLGENDFVNVAYFSEKANWTGCFHTFVQANYRNKMRLEMFVDKLLAHGMASYSAAMEFAFMAFDKFSEHEGNETGRGVGADCNRIIMVLTDGGTEMPEDVFLKHNKDKEIRVFSYAVGPTANPISAVRWMACYNRGYFYQIPAMGAIRSTVQAYVGLLPHVDHTLQTELYNDYRGLGMMTTVTLPVYNKTDEKGNQTLLGVMGCDVTVGEMEENIPYLQLGPNGYAFAINANGYIVFHPNLKAKNGWLTSPPNVDFVEVEYESEDKIELRKKMIDGDDGSMTIETYIFQPNERYIDNTSRIYHYTPVEDTDFSVGIVLPEYSDLYWESPHTKLENTQGLEYLVSSESDVLFSTWDRYCSNINEINENTTYQDNLWYTLENNFTECDNTWTQWMFYDAKITKELEDTWNLDTTEGIEARFVGTSSGLTRVFPAGASYLMETMTDTWSEVYYRRAQDRKTEWLFSAPYHQGGYVDENSTSPFVMVTKAVEMNNGFMPAVVGVLVNQSAMIDWLMAQVPECDERICYLVDDGGFLVLSTDEEHASHVGRFLGDIEPVLMSVLVNRSIFVENIQYDYQAACPVKKETFSAGPRTVALPLIFEMLSINWWMTKLAWMYVNFNIFEWLFSSPYHYATAEEYFVEESNYSCIKKLAQYTLPDQDVDIKKNLVCDNCTRTYATASIEYTNLLLVMVDYDCGGTCEVPHLVQFPEETTDPSFPNDTTCHLTERYRRRPPCFDNNPDEITDECSRGYSPTASLMAMLLPVLLVLILAGR